MKRNSPWSWAGVLLCALVLGACVPAGDQEDDDDDDDGQGGTYSIIANVTGLTASGLVLQNNGTGTLPVATGATTVAIAASVTSGTTYAVTIQSQPTGLACRVVNGSGTVSGNVSNITIACSIPYLVSGTISGYTGSGLALRLNGQTGAAFNTSPASGANSFGFAAGLASGATYNVGVTAQPTNPGQACIVASGGNGTVASANVTNVTITCVDNQPFTVGGTITGLTGAGLSLRMYYTAPGGQTVPVALNVAATDPTFQFAETIAAGGSFTIGILTQPANQSCVLARGRGTSPTSVTNVGVTCLANVASTLVGTYTRLDPSGRLYLNFNADGTFTDATVYRDADCNTATDTRNGNGVEYGAFTWNASSNRLDVLGTGLLDTNGSCGLSNAGAAASGIAFQKGLGTITFPDDQGAVVLTAIAAPNPTTSVVGAFVPEAGNGRLLVLQADNTFLFAETQARGGAFQNTQERGCYSVTAGQITFVVDGSCKPDGLNAYDFNGAYGLGQFTATPSIGPLSFVIESGTVLVFNG